MFLEVKVPSYQCLPLNDPDENLCKPKFGTGIGDEWKGMYLSHV